MRLIFVFLVAGLTGLMIQATLVHSSFPAAVAPDFILILTVAVALYYHNVPGLVGAFALGLLADFASSNYLGPNAAGCVVAFCLVGLIANRVYADKVIAVFILSFVCSVAKTATAFLMLYFYVDGFFLPAGGIRSAMLEGLLSAFFAPIVLQMLRSRVTTSSTASKAQGAAVFRWSS